MSKTTWRAELTGALGFHGETWNDVVACTLAAEELDVVFDDGFGEAEGKPFTLWTKQRVYFPTEYDGSESVRSVPREPCDEATSHCGG